VAVAMIGLDVSLLRRERKSIRARGMLQMKSKGHETWAQKGELLSLPARYHNWCAGAGPTALAGSPSERHRPDPRTLLLGRAA
jgi:hypothetical protein